MNLHRIHNYNHSFLCGYNGAKLFFTPVAIAVVKSKKGDSYLYRMGFGTMGKNNEVSPFLYKVNNDYVSIGSGATYARLVIAQQDRLYSTINMKLSDLSTETIVGIVGYILNEVKQLDLETGGETQVAIVNHDGFRILSHNEQMKCHQIMTDNLFSSLNEYFSNKDKASKIFSCLFPYE